MFSMEHVLAARGHSFLIVCDLHARFGGHSNRVVAIVKAAGKEREGTDGSTC